jgi:DNA-binding response OmpR family regulator
MTKPPKHILIIDDNEDMLTMLAIILRDKNYIVTARKSFDNFDKEITELAPGVVLIDKNLVWGDGCSLYKTIRTIPEMNGVTVLVFSAYTISAQECKEAGANACFEKPFGMMQFLQSIEPFLVLD